MSTTEPSPGSIQKAFAALLKIAELPGPITPKELAQLTQTPLPSTYHLLRVLVDLGALVKLDREATD